MDLTKHPYYPRNPQGDALAERGIGAMIDKDGTFPYPDAVNMRRVQGINATTVSMLPFPLARNRSVGVPRSASIEAR